MQTTAFASLISFRFGYSLRKFSTTINNFSISQSYRTFKLSPVRAFSHSRTKEVEMDITKDNFEEILPIFEEKLNSCDYMAVDAEMTGLHVEKSRFTIQ